MKTKLLGPVSRKTGNFSGPKANFKITTCWKVAQFLSHKPVTFASLTDSFIVLFLKIIETLILNANTTSTKHLSGPEKFPGLRETGPWLVTVACRTVLFLASLRRANASEPGERDTPCSFGPCRACLTLHARIVLCSPEKRGENSACSAG